ncbi:uncharacterized protein LOC120006234 [Tripterygium wilfordii]|uniref:uncharacterized protein LOC120006234 n=1 Tax=Tripterygium wilfordii TaxID=458696 RepID=UPI0018F815B4|nr:uncharacterized protein LOC120006234 [Tripterygium wilfordii]
MKLLLWRWYPLSSSRIKSGRNWVCKTSPINIIRKRPKRFLNIRLSNDRVGSRKIKEGTADADADELPRNHARGSVMSLMTQKKAKSTGSRLGCRTKERSFEAIELEVEELRAKVSKKRAELKRMKQQQTQVKAQQEEMKSEHAVKFEENRRNFEKNFYERLYVDAMAIALVYGGA